MDVRTLLAASALLLAGCEVYAVPNPLPCPGDRQGTFDFAMNLLVTPNMCQFAVPGDPTYQVVTPVTFQGTINFGPEPTAATLCISQAHAVARTGTHTPVPNVSTPPPQDIDVAYEDRTGSVGACTCPSAAAVTAGGCLCPPNTPLTGCSCPVVVVERIQGTLVPVTDGNGGYSGLANATQVVSVSPRIGPGPDPCDCLKPCSYSYEVTAASVGSR